MSIEKRISPLFKVREDLNRTETARRILRSLRTLAFFSVHRAIDMQVLTDLKRNCLFGCCSEPARRAIGLPVAARFVLLSEAGFPGWTG